jgi:hypothetical protein
MLIVVSCGVFETDGLLTVNPPRNISLSGWSIELHYKGQKKPTFLKTKSEEDANKCYEEIIQQINNISNPIPFSK